MRKRWTSMLLRFAVLALLAVVGLPSGADAQEEPPIPVCQGFVATIYVRDGRVVGGPDDGMPYRGVLRGTPGDDVIAGTDGPDLIKGHAGNDIICGGGGDDIIEAGEGDDRVDGGPGHDLIKGQQGDDSIAGGDGDDRIDGGPGNDQLDGGGGVNRIRGGTGINTCLNGTVGSNLSDHQREHHGHQQPAAERGVPRRQYRLGLRPRATDHSTRWEIDHRQWGLLELSRPRHPGEQLVLDVHLPARADRSAPGSGQLRRSVCHLRSMCPVAGAGLVRKGDFHLRDRHGHRRPGRRWVHDHDCAEQLHGRRHARVLFSTRDRGQHVCRAVGSDQQQFALAPTMTRCRARRDCRGEEPDGDDRAGDLGDLGRVSFDPEGVMTSTAAPPARPSAPRCARP